VTRLPWEGARLGDQQATEDHDQQNNEYDI
jgi:hypothetical protein